MKKITNDTLNIIIIAVVITALIIGMVLVSGCKGGDMTIEEEASTEDSTTTGEIAKDVEDPQEDTEETEETEETPVEITEAIEIADDYFDEGMYAEAAKEYRDAARMIKDADISQELEEELLSAISQNHQDAESITETARMHHGNAMTLQYEKRFEEAKAELEAALDIYPKYQTAIDALDSLEALMGLK
ncbi:MAG: hypothetical protein MUO59_00380 [Actinobacteria bacterium]|nr:hypothetical protein [Actinomycetota bacterium]